MNTNIKNKLKDISAECGGQVFFDHPMKGHSTIAIGGSAGAWYVPASEEELKALVSFLEDAGERSYVIGNGSNVLLPDAGLDAVVITLSGGIFAEKEFTQDTVRAGAGVLLAGLVSDCCRRGLSGLEGLVGIPATVGGAIVMNAGYKGSISDDLVKVRVLDRSGEVKWVDRTGLSFGYRSSSFKEGDIILEAVFSLSRGESARLTGMVRENFAEKMERQPLDKKSLGCVFRNPEGEGSSSGELIDRAGLKGAVKGGAMFSEKHANFIVNEGDAASGDVTFLMEEAREKVRKMFSVELEDEIEIWK